jgi:hypothetical protein
MRNTGSRRGTARSRENAPLLENGGRTAALQAVTGCVIATAAKNQIDPDRNARLAERHHREDPDR